MSDEKKSLSPRGSFLIGFALGAGLGFLLYQQQTTRLNAELGRVQAENQIITKRLQNAQGEIAASRIHPAPAAASK